jgi:hypothetical protein
VRGLPCRSLCLDNRSWRVIFPRGLREIPRSSA